MEKIPKNSHSAGPATETHSGMGNISSKNCMQYRQVSV